MIISSKKKDNTRRWIQIHDRLQRLLFTDNTSSEELEKLRNNLLFFFKRYALLTRIYTCPVTEIIRILLNWIDWMKVYIHYFAGIFSKLKSQNNNWLQRDVAALYAEHWVVSRIPLLTELVLQSSLRTR